MRAQPVLVAFASQNGSTAAIAEVIAAELQLAGIQVDVRPVSTVEGLRPYRALVLGSGVFLPGRASDGGGFLAHHASAVSHMPVWLFCAGPIGRGRTADGSPASDCPVVDVARAIGARGAAAFGSLSMDRGADEFDRPVDMRRVREWARGIASELGHPSLAAAS
ncbi:MAG TPA: flavodoxin domain-containing protein [Candidatus Limnocylindrales bacterium]|nr:flavodoxin domain-containing protein [Candidatus Limnocylindrales bacterium]